jgi:hypothetical protein
MTYGGAAMRSLSLLPLLLILAVCCCAQSQPGRPIRAKIEGTELDRRMLLEKLNAHAQDHHLSFELAESDYDYRIVFSTGQGTTQTQWGELNSSVATADVFDPQETELFRFDRKGRGSDKRATDAVAKEIIKRILMLKKLKP